MSFRSGYKIHRTLFCTTDQGKTAIVRHLEPSLYVDDDLTFLQTVRKYLSDVVLITSDSHLPSPNAPSLNDYFYPTTSSSTFSSYSSSSIMLSSLSTNS